MFDFHSDTDRYLETQCDNCRRFVIPFIEEVRPVGNGIRVLEIGCGSAGVLKAFLDRGCTGAGIDIWEPSIAIAREKLADFGDTALIAKDIYAVDVERDLGGRFDIVVLKDVIEHIHDQEKLLALLQAFLKPDGLIFFGFPPWQMPFGGHQQVMTSRVLSHTPWLHLLPKSLYAGAIRLFGDHPASYLEIKETGISIERFERIARRTGYTIAGRQFHLFNPIYEYKFGLKMRKQSPIVAAIPWLRNFVTTSAFYIIKPLNQNEV